MGENAAWLPRRTEIGERAEGPGQDGTDGPGQGRGVQPTASQNPSWASLGVCLTSAMRGPPRTRVLGASGVNGGQPQVFGVLGHRGTREGRHGVDEDVGQQPLHGARTDNGRELRESVGAEQER